MMNVQTGAARSDIFREIVMSYCEATNHNTFTDNFTLHKMKRYQIQKYINDVICAPIHKILYLFVDTNRVTVQ